MAEHDFDVAVIGAGIVSTCTALALQEAGHRFTLIDRDGPGRTTSYGNAGVISLWTGVPQALPGIWKSLPGMMLSPHRCCKIAATHATRYLGWLRRFLRESYVERGVSERDALDARRDQNASVCITKSDRLILVITRCVLYSLIQSIR